jgi:hypothetical protein
MSCLPYHNLYKNLTPWPQSVSKLYHSSIVGEVSANFCGQKVSRGQRSGSSRLYSRFSRLEPLLFLPSSSSIVLTRLSDPIPDELLLRKSGRARNRTQTSGSVARNFCNLHNLTILSKWHKFYLIFISSPLAPNTESKVAMRAQIITQSLRVLPLPSRLKSKPSKHAAISKQKAEHHIRKDSGPLLERTGNPC